MSSPQVATENIVTNELARLCIGMGTAIDVVVSKKADSTLSERKEIHKIFYLIIEAIRSAAQKLWKEYEAMLSTNPDADKAKYCSIKLIQLSKLFVGMTREYRQERNNSLLSCIKSPALYTRADIEDDVKVKEIMDAADTWVKKTNDVLLRLRDMMTSALSEVVSKR